MKIENVVRERLLKDPKFRKEYESKDTRDLTIRVSSKIQEARIYSGFTQTSLAKKMKTHQSSVARAERGNSLPSLTFLQKIAEALGTYLVEPSFGFLEKKTQGWRERLNDNEKTVFILPKTQSNNYSTHETKSKDPFAQGGSISYGFKLQATNFGAGHNS